MSAAARKKAHEPKHAPNASVPGFGGLIGQDTVVRALRRALERGRLPHALLFTGPQGVGKATCAGVLAQALNCNELGPGEACGTCRSCSRLARGIHPDLLWVYRHDKRASIAITQIRPGRPSDSFTPDHEPVNRFVGYAPHEGRRRVVVIDDAHLMYSEAQNALLKTLEEPPASTVLILVTPTPSALLPTVRSRCQSLTFSPVPQSQVRAHLEQEHGLEAEEARLRAALVPGSIGRALSVDLDTYGTMLEQVVDALRLAQEGPAGVIAAAEALAGLGDGTTALQKASDTLGVGRNVLRDLLVVSAGADASSLVHPDRIDAWRTWSEGLDPDRIAEALAALNHGLDRLAAKPQPAARMAIERTLIDVYRAFEGETPATGAAAS